MAQRAQATGCLSKCCQCAPDSLQDAPACVAALAHLGSDEPLASDTEMLLPKSLATPVPKLQLGTLCLVRLVDPISFTQIFPYVNQMILDLDVARTPSQVGFYSGIVDSIFAVSQMTSIYHWAKLSDTIGRRPVILAGALGVAFATLLFGLSESFASVLITRSLAGILAGNIATIHAVLGEITDASNQAVAFPIYGLCFPLGSMVGPLIGGTFSHPAEKFELFRNMTLFQAHPYFLPCLISAIISLFGAALGWCYLEESLPSKRRELITNGTSSEHIDAVKASGTVMRTNAHDGPFEGDPPIALSQDSGSKMGMSALLAIPTLRALAASGFALSFLSCAFDVVFVLFCYSPIPTGGLDYPAEHIGYALAIAGATAAMLQLVVMPSLLRRVPPAAAYKICMKLWPIAYAALPLLNILARVGMERGAKHEIKFLKPAYAAAIWIGIGACLAITRVANLAYSLSMILVKETSPNPAALGAANGIAQFSMCMARAIAPAFVSTLFAASVDNNILGSYLWVFIMVCLGIVSIRITEKVNVQYDESVICNS